MYERRRARGSLRRSARRRAGALALALIALALGCQTRSARIRDNQELFDSYPAEDQAAIRAGRIEVGFTDAQVQMALGDPDEVRRRVDAEGETVVWAYRTNRPTVGVGIGGGTYGGFGSVGVRSGGEVVYQVVVHLAQGVVTEIEYFD